jgi:hypothetical protein
MQAAIGLALLAPGIRAVLPNAPQVTRSEAWKLGWAARGKYFNDALGAKLPDNYPVIDDFPNGIATSNKSIDLEARSYQNPTVLRSQIKRYINEVSEFNGTDRRGFEIESSEIRGRALTLVIPRGSGSRAQQSIIDEAKAYAKERGVRVTIVPF